MLVCTFDNSEPYGILTTIDSQCKEKNPFDCLHHSDKSRQITVTSSKHSKMSLYEHDLEHPGRNSQPRNNNEFSRCRKVINVLEKVNF